MNTKSFSAIVNQATTKDGSLKAKLSLTALAQDTSVSVETNGTAYINGTEVNLNAVVAAALLPAYDDKYAQTLDDTIQLYAEGYVSPIQRNIAKAIAEGGVTTTKKLSPIISTKRLLTADEYKGNCIKLAELDNVELYNSISGLLNDNKVTKDRLLQYLETLQHALLSNEQFGTYENMLAAEELAAKQFERLTEAGFIAVQRLSEKDIQAIIPAAEVKTSVPKLVELGYKLTNTVFNNDTFDFTVFFSEAEQENIVK